MTNPSSHGNSTITSRHEMLDAARCAKFSGWIDAQLRVLEQRFAGFITQQSAHGTDLSAHFGDSRRRRKTT